MEDYSPEDFDEKEINTMEAEIEDDPALLLLSDELMDEDDESEIYEMEDDYQEEDFEDEIIAGTPQPPYSDEMDDASFYNDDDPAGSEEGLVQENPFEPVYPAAAAGLLFDDSTSASAVDEPAAKGIVLEAISLDNILPAGSRRRRN